MNAESLTLGGETRLHPPLVRPRVTAQTVQISALSVHDKERMYMIFSKYYDNHHYATFLQDLSEKNHVILLKDAVDGSIQGFSTLLQVPLMSGGRKALGVYSGDTVLEKEYWGSSALGVSFLKYLWLLKLKNPGKPVYWFLISKGYKTYLLMANNFKTHFPRFDAETPAAYRQIMDDFYGRRFGSLYKPETGVIEMEGSSCALREKIAEVTPELMQNPKVAFFAERNPHWERGYELSCLAKMTLGMPLAYILKKRFQRKKR